jgi:hypothetical protein
MRTQPAERIPAPVTAARKSPVTRTVTPVLTSAKLVRKSAAVVDGFDGLAEFAG